MAFKKTLESLIKTREVQFIFSAGGIYFSYLYYGVIQEKLYKSNYSSDPSVISPKFTFSFALILFQMFFAALIAGFFCTTEQRKFQCSFKEILQLGLFNFGTMYSANSALKLVTYPLQALTKSCKILSVLLVGFTFGGQRFTAQQFICGGLITLGIFLFNFFEGGKKSSGESSYLGIILLILSLFCDGMLASVQSNIIRLKKISQWEMMFHISTVGFVASFLVGVTEVSEFYKFITEYPSILIDLSVLSFLGGIGQCFIFHCIKTFSPRILSIVTTTRKFFTVLFSIFYYGHEIQQIQWLSIGLIGVSLIWELKTGSKKAHQKQ